jgi:hypothetical protein
LVPPILAERAADLVCVVGEANAWPYRSAERGAGLHPDELVHWVAHRPATGDSFAMVVAPESPIAPRTASHVRLAEATIAAGAPIAELRRAWRAFVRDDDVICHWGHYAPALFASAGGHLPAARVDLRQVARTVAGGRVGSLEDVAAALGVEAPPITEGRAGDRLAKLAAVARRYADLASG